MACQSQTRLMNRHVKQVPGNTEEVKTNRPEFKCQHVRVSANDGHLQIFAFHMCRYDVTSILAVCELDGDTTAR